MEKGVTETTTRENSWVVDFSLFPLTLFSLSFCFSLSLFLPLAVRMLHSGNEEEKANNSGEIE